MSPAIQPKKKTTNYLFDHDDVVQIICDIPKKVKAIKSGFNAAFQAKHGMPDGTSHLGCCWDYTVPSLTAGQADSKVKVYAGITPVSKLGTGLTASEENKRRCDVQGFPKFCCKASKNNPNNPRYRKVKRQDGFIQLLIDAARANVVTMVKEEGDAEKLKQASAMFHFASSSTLNAKYSQALQEPLGIPVRLTDGIKKKTQVRFSLEILQVLNRNPKDLLNLDIRLSSKAILWLASQKNLSTKDWMNKTLAQAVDPVVYAEMVKLFPPDELVLIEKMRYADSCAVQLVQYALSNRISNARTRGPVSLNRSSDSGLHPALASKLKLSIFELTPSMVDLIKRAQLLVGIDDDARSLTSIRLLTQTIKQINPGVELVFITIFDGRAVRAPLAETKLPEIGKDDAWKAVANKPLNSKSHFLEQLKTLHAATATEPANSIVVYHEGQSFPSYVTAARKELGQPFVYEKLKTGGFLVKIGEPGSAGNVTADRLLALCKEFKTNPKASTVITYTGPSFKQFIQYYRKKLNTPFTFKETSDSTFTVTIGDTSTNNQTLLSLSALLEAFKSNPAAQVTVQYTGALTFGTYLKYYQKKLQTYFSFSEAGPGLFHVKVADATEIGNQTLKSLSQLCDNAKSDPLASVVVHYAGKMSFGQFLIYYKRKLQAEFLFEALPNQDFRVFVGKAAAKPSDTVEKLKTLFPDSPSAPRNSVEFDYTGKSAFIVWLSYYSRLLGKNFKYDNREEGKYRVFIGNPGERSTTLLAYRSKTRSSLPKINPMPAAELRPTNLPQVASEFNMDEWLAGGLTSDTQVTTDKPLKLGDKVVFCPGKNKAREFGEITRQYRVTSEVTFKKESGQYTRRVPDCKLSVSRVSSLSEMLANVVAPA